ncbi:MAG: hypothetical protein NVSMB6_22770 [Burkholderiaceae bacterium]
MASFEKRAGAWRAAIKFTVEGKVYREASSFPTKAQASAWAAERETQMRKEITAGASGVVEGKTLRDACERYEIEVSRTKWGHRWEALRLNALVNMKVGKVILGTIELQNLTADILGQWRDMRLKTVQGATVNREMNLLSHVLSTARDEWQWMAESPTSKVRRPKDSQPRNRLVKPVEMEKLAINLGFNDEPIQTKSQAVMVAFLFGIETAMRAGEITSLRPSSISGRVAHLPITKNGTKRDVALSCTLV